MANKSIKIMFLPADSGDCFLILFNENEKQIAFLIDGGYKTRYRIFLEKSLMENFLKPNSHNYIFITHTDDDHIGGIQAFFSDKKVQTSLVKSVLYNTVHSLKCLTPEATDSPEAINIEDNSLTQTSYKSGIALEEKLKELEIPIISDIIAPRKIKLEDVDITFLSPRFETMKKYKSWLDIKEKKTQTSSGTNDYSEDLDILKDKVFEEDISITNASSISMLIEYGKRKLLFLGDSVPSDIVTSLIELGYSEENKLRVDVVKVAHHGSRKNTCNGFLKHIICDNFLISTNGTNHNHPDKECLARIINFQNKPNLIFNYNRYKKIFSKKELEKATFNVSEEREINWHEQ